MPEFNPEQDIAKGLAEFRQGRKSLLPEFELPTDDIPEQEQLEPCPERLISMLFQQILDELKVGEVLKNPGFLDKLSQYIAIKLEDGPHDIEAADIACTDITILKKMGLELPTLSYQVLDQNIRQPEFIANLEYRLMIDIQTAEDYPASVTDAVIRANNIISLGLTLPILSEEQINEAILDPNFLIHLNKAVDLYIKKSYVVESYQGWVRQLCASIIELGLDLSDGNNQKIMAYFTDPAYINALKQKIMTLGKNEDHSILNSALYLEEIYSLRTIIKYYSGLADEKEKAQAAHKLQTAADRTGVPPRPEQKAF